MEHQTQENVEMQADSGAGQDCRRSKAIGRMGGCEDE